MIGKAVLAGTDRVDGQIFDLGENPRRDPAGQSENLPEGFSLYIGILRKRHGGDKGLNHARKLGIIAPIWQMVFVKLSRQLHITAN